MAGRKRKWTDKRVDKINRLKERIIEYMGNQY